MHRMFMQTGLLVAVGLVAALVGRILGCWFPVTAVAVMIAAWCLGRTGR